MHTDRLYSRVVALLKNYFCCQSTSLEPDPKSKRTVSEKEIRKCRYILERILSENILPFWYPEVIDVVYGGYRLNHDIQGKWKGDVNKNLVIQARTLWFFSRLCNSRYESKNYHEAARHGFQFLTEKMWDPDNGGFFWEVDVSGNNVITLLKDLYGQAFGLYALSEYAIACGDKSAIKFARELFRLLYDKAYDQQYGGYREFFLAAWKLPQKDVIGPLGAPSDVKLMNTHLHLMEAITLYYRLTRDELAYKQIVELVLILSNSVIRKTIGACADKHLLDWTRVSGPEHDLVSYGHDLENIWMLIDACQTVNLPNSLLLELYRFIFGYAVRFGYDKNRGGFYVSGSPNKPADRKEKLWWVQAESLISALYMYYLTADENYWHCFRNTLNWIDQYQTDWTNGDWYALITEKGSPAGDKAGMWWKTPYHNGRAMIQCLERLSHSVSETP